MCGKRTVFQKKTWSMYSVVLVIFLMLLTMLSSCQETAVPTSSKDAPWLKLTDNGEICFNHDYVKSAPKKIIIPSVFNGEKITKISAGTEMLSAFGHNDRVTEIIVCEGIEQIDLMAFRNCRSLKAVTFPSTIRSIDHNIFIHCDRLETIYYCGSKEAWDAIEKDDDDFEGIHIIFNAKTKES